MKLVVCTSPRPENYIRRIFQTIKEDIKIHLIVNGEDTAYVSQYLLLPNVSVTTVPTTSTNVLFRQFINYKQGLLDGYVEGDDGILIVEDDIKFAKGWKCRLDEIIGGLKTIHGDTFALTLFTAKTICRNNDLPPLHYAQFPSIYEFMGTQGMYYTNAVRKNILAYFDIFNESNVINFDRLISRALKAANIPLYVAIPCLIDHIGFKSTWSSNKFTTAATIFHPTLS